jgi:iron complex transport system substrate-binding protein
VRRGRRPLAVLILAAALVASACGATSDDRAVPAGPQPVAAAGEAAPAAVPRLPVTVTDVAGRAVTVNDVSRVVVLNGDVAEIVFALGLGANVVATDISATHPAEAKALPKIGYQRTLNAEGILAQNPTLVLGDEAAGPPAVLDQLRSAGVAVVQLATGKDIATPPAKIRSVAAALGVAEAGERLAAATAAEIDSARRAAEVRAAAKRPRVAFLYVRGTTTLMLGGKGSGADAMIAAAGGIDAGTAAGISNFAPLTPESLVAASPDVLLLLSAGLESVGGVDGLLGLPGVAQTAAGQARRVLHYDDLYLLGLGPRTGAAVADLARGLHGA